MSARPGVTVAISSYNYARYLPATLHSALAQEGVDLEVIVVDDASSDDSVRIAQDAARRDPRVRVIAHEANRGHIATFNEALGAATREYVVKLDSDDLLVEGALVRAARVLDAHPRVGMVYGRAIPFGDVPPAPARLAGAVRVWPGRRWLAVRARKATNVIFQPEVMVRRQVLAQTDGHRAHIPAAHDLNLWLRLATLADVAYLHADQGYYREHGDSLLHSVYSGYLSDLRQRRLAFLDWLATMSPADAERLGAPALERAVRRALARQALEWAARNATEAPESAEEHAELAAFAAETSPGSTSWTARALAAVPRGASAGRGGRAAGALIERGLSARDALTWRRWRRFGI